MKCSSISKIALVALCVSGLSACGLLGRSNSAENSFAAPRLTPPSGQEQAAGNAATQASATTFAGRAVTTFKTAANGMRINPLTAPANQSYYFAFDLTSMRPQDLTALNIQANYLVSHPSAKIRLDGNTDDRGSREYNIGLGWRRDQAVARFLEQQGVKPSQIQMVSYGKERPVALGNNPRSWAMNRRVDLIYKAY